MKKLPTDKPVAIPDPTSYINKANLMAIGHDTCLEILDQLVPQDRWETPKHMALLTEMGIDAAAISRCNSIQVPFVKVQGLERCDVHRLLLRLCFD